MGCRLPGSSVHGILQARLSRLPGSPPENLPDPGIEAESLTSQRRQPTRLPRLWDSPGKNTGVGCHFLLQCMKVKSESEVAQSDS